MVDFVPTTIRDNQPSLTLTVYALVIHGSTGYIVTSLYKLSADTAGYEKRNVGG